MKRFNTIMRYLFFFLFVGSCSIGIFNDADNFKRVGIFLFFVCWILAMGDKDEKK